MYSNAIKLFLRGLMLAIIIAVIFMVYRIYQEANVAVRQQINKIAVFSLDSISLSVDFDEKDTTIILLFNSECDICLIELEEYKKLSPELKHYRVILLSFQTLSEIRKVHKEHELSSYNNIEILKPNDEKSVSMISDAPNPSTFVFNNKGKLIYEKRGYLKPELLINKIRMI